MQSTQRVPLEALQGNTFSNLTEKCFSGPCALPCCSASLLTQGALSSSRGPEMQGWRPGPPSLCSRSPRELIQDKSAHTCRKFPILLPHVSSKSCGPYASHEAQGSLPCGPGSSLIGLLFPSRLQG